MHPVSPTLRHPVCVLAVIAVMMAPSGVVAGDISVLESTLDAPDSIAVGDELSFRVEIEHPADTDIEISSPDEGSRWSEIDRQLQTTDDEPLSTTVADIEYAIYRPGQTSGPPIDIATNGQPADVFVAHHPVHVEAVSPEDETLGQPRSPRPMWSQHGLFFWFVFGTFGVGVIAVITALALRRQWYSSADDLADPPAHTRALEALEHLAKNPPEHPDEFKPFYVRLSHILRRYVGQRWDVPGTELTTTELVARLHRVDHPQLDVDGVESWLRACDRVKFAGHLPEPEHIEDHLREAFEIVESTIDDPEPESEDSPDETSS